MLFLSSLNRKFHITFTGWRFVVNSFGFAFAFRFRSCLLVAIPFHYGHVLVFCFCAEHIPHSIHFRSFPFCAYIAPFSVPSIFVFCAKPTFLTLSSRPFWYCLFCLLALFILVVLALFYCCAKPPTKFISPFAHFSDNTVYVSVLDFHHL